MDEDNFSELCFLNAKKPPPEPFTKLLRTSSRPDNVKKVYKTAVNTYELEEPLTTKTAVEFLLNDKLKTEVCRYCLNITPGLSELDQVLSIAGTGSLYKVTIRQMIACFYPIKANEDPNFPDKICQKCLDKAIGAYLFTQQCEQAERALLFCFNDMYEKLNKLDPLDRPKKRGRQKQNPNHNVLYAEHKKVIEYAEPVRNIINVAAESLTTEPDWNEFECKKCWQVFTNMESLLNHEKIHPKDMWYNCRLCGKSFAKLTQLKKHHNQVHVLGKVPEVSVEKLFRCEQCAHVSENHTQHIQHLELHKFKCVLQHLIHRKMDKLCMVCLNNSASLEDMEKMISFNGGFPELLGDKTLQSVLASVLPDTKPNSYRDITVAHVAKMLLSKSNTKIDSKLVPNLENPTNEDWPSPIIVTKDKFKTDNFYYYVFPDPELETDGKKTNKNAARDVETSEMCEVADKMLVGLDKNDNEVPTHSKNIKRLTQKVFQKNIISRKGLKRAYQKGVPKGDVKELIDSVEAAKSKNLQKPSNIDEDESCDDLVKQITELIGDGNDKKNDEDYVEPIAVKKRRVDEPKKNKKHERFDSKVTVYNVEKGEDITTNNNNLDEDIINPNTDENANNANNNNLNEDMIETDQKNETNIKDNNYSDENVVYQDLNLENEIVKNNNNLNKDMIDQGLDNNRKENDANEYTEEKSTSEANTNTYTTLNREQSRNTTKAKQNSDWEKNWVFKNSYGYDCPAITEENPINTEAEKIPDCGHCWVFKNSYRCEHCKKVNVKNFNINLNDIPLPVEDPVRPKPILENVITESAKERNPNEAVFRPLLANFPIEEETWQCDICQTANPVDVLVCKCVESDNSMDSEDRRNRTEEFQTSPSDSSDSDVMEIHEDTNLDSKDKRELPKVMRIKEANIDITDSLDGKGSTSKSPPAEEDGIIKFDIGATTITGPRRAILPKAFHK